MQHVTRRLALFGAGTLAAGTLAATAMWRKPSGDQSVLPGIFTPASAAETPVLGALVPTTPPRPPAEASFADADGTIRHVQDFPGKGLIINLWATWCVPCVAELPALQALAKTLAPEGILVLPLSSDRGGADVVRKFYAAHGVESLPIWLDPKGAVARAWAARGLPTTLVIDRQGREVARVEGAAEWASPEFVTKLRNLIG